ncbi:MAG: histidine phosphatase family protein [Geminicoccaceae bacterium]
MTSIVRYLSHPEALIDPFVDVRRWGLSPKGQARLQRLIDSDCLAGTSRVISSDETKAIETAAPIADRLGCELETRTGMHENDRSATGFIPPDEFKRVADQFFAFPNESIRGWERAVDAQDRVCEEVDDALSNHHGGDVLLVGHGGVGTLLYCRYANKPISRAFDQPFNGCLFAFSLMDRRILHGWRPIEEMALAEEATQVR